MQLRYPAPIQAALDNTRTSLAELYAQMDLRLERAIDQKAIAEFERENAIWAQHRAPLNVAKGMFFLPSISTTRSNNPVN